MSNHGGFTLLEVLLVAALLAMIATFSVGVYRNYGVNIQLEATRKNIIYDLRQMQVRAAAGESRRNFGAHFVNGSQDYYELFSTPSNYADGGKTTLSLVYLPGTVVFIRPSNNASQDIIFSSITGATTADYITISSENNAKSVNTTASGSVY
jgi:prepilin-type N-terminal cleavage/methylation domain-containing protein